MRAGAPGTRKGGGCDTGARETGKGGARCRLVALLPRCNGPSSSVYRDSGESEIGMELAGIAEDLLRRCGPLFPHWAEFSGEMAGKRFA